MRDVAAPVRVLYVAGNGRSGSTLLDRILGQLPGVASLGEVRFLWEFGHVRNNLCECGARFRECPFWTAVLETAVGALTDERAARLARESRRLLWTPGIARLLGPLGTPAFRRMRDEHAEIAGQLYRAVARRTGADWLVDSSKLASYALLLARVPGLELHVVHLVRDSRAVAFSWQRKRLKPEVEGGRTYMPVRAPLLTALRWDVHNLLDRSLAAVAKSYVRIRYEDLVLEPRKAIETIASTAGLGPVDPDFALDGVVQVERGHTVAGNPMRFKDGPVKLRLDDEWRASLPAPSKALVSLLTLPQLLAYGYPLAQKEVVRG